jgi:hypothetical protein
MQGEQQDSNAQGQTQESVEGHQRRFIASLWHRPHPNTKQQGIFRLMGEN